MRRHPSQARAQRTFSTVLDAAVALIEREGIERATTRRIALAAGVSIGAVYEYFPNKESIVSHLGTNWLRRIREIIEALHPSHSAIPDLLGYLHRMQGDIELSRSTRPARGRAPDGSDSGTARSRAGARRGGTCIRCQCAAPLRSRRGSSGGPIDGELHDHHESRRAECMLDRANRRCNAAAAHAARFDLRAHDSHPAVDSNRRALSGSSHASTDLTLDSKRANRPTGGHRP